MQRSKLALDVEVFTPATAISDSGGRDLSEFRARESESLIDKTIKISSIDAFNVASKPVVPITDDSRGDSRGHILGAIHLSIAPFMRRL